MIPFLPCPPAPSLPRPARPLPPTDLPVGLAPAEEKPPVSADPHEEADEADEATNPYTPGELILLRRIEEIQATIAVILEKMGANAEAAASPYLRGDRAAARYAGFGCHKTFSLWAARHGVRAERTVAGKSLSQPRAGKVKQRAGLNIWRKADIDRARQPRHERYKDEGSFRIPL